MENKYSKQDNQTAKDIRAKYTPAVPKKVQRIQELDKKVQTAGRKKLISKIFWGALFITIGILIHSDIIPYHLGWMIVSYFIGVFTLLFAYPSYISAKKKAHKKYVPEIMRLSEEIEKGI